MAEEPMLMRMDVRVRGPPKEEGWFVREGPSENHYKVWPLLSVVCFPCIGALLVGFDMGGTAWMMVAIKLCSHQHSGWCDTIEDNVYLGATLEAFAAIGGMTSCIFLYWYGGNRLGGRTELILAGMFFTIGSTMEAESAEIPKSVAGLYVCFIGRFIYGWGLGFSLHSIPNYVAEHSPPNLRGTLCSFLEFFMTVGQIYSYAIGQWLTYEFPYEYPWKYTFKFGTLFGIMMFFGMLALPESPRWLVSAGRPLYEALEVAAGLVCANQLTGLPGMTYYCIDIFKEVAPSSLMIAVSSFAVSKLLGCLIIIFYMDVWGRRASLIGGLLVMFLSTMALFLLFYDSLQRDSDFKWVFVILLDLFVIGFEFSVGNVTFVLLGEIFPGDVKGEALSIAFIVMFALSASMLFLLYWEISDIGYSIVWAQLSIMAFVFLFFAASLVPETMNKTLEQIQRDFQEEFDVPDFLAAVEYLSTGASGNDSDEDELNEGTPLLNRSTSGVSVGGGGGGGGNNNGDVETGRATTSPLVDNDPAILRQRGSKP